MQKIEIPSDADGVFVDSHWPVLMSVNWKMKQIYPDWVPIQYNQLTGWTAMDDIVTARTGNCELAKLMGGTWFLPDILKIAGPNKPFIEALNWCISKLNIDLLVVTTRNWNCTEVTRWWLNQYFPDINWKRNLFIRKKKDSRSGDDFKVETLRNIPNKVLMTEDNLITYGKIVEAGFRCNLVNRPWNMVKNEDPKTEKLRIEPSDGVELIKRIKEWKCTFV